MIKEKWTNRKLEINLSFETKILPGNIIWNINKYAHLFLYVIENCISKYDK